MFQNRSEGYPELLGLALSVLLQKPASFDTGELKLHYMITMSHPLV